ncbi:large subunit of transcription factor tfIIE [Scheffersomyces stipitis CBS 6054]|uniref:Large subunit of transcription factor tfIIE n=1 Tax=Scheffersomyces stipitis (strain ATCC 58785 / CBS 6054 / NBRC 10063 / NRRL Y-11545) TaxID=322104 RepID=A3GHL9_PICST|nr:large subunit of transcription factor tfIIE [Scheffersomyces stipitis CBS 6054]EAZ63074.1 large subunit of transcription factor tfIIE [Scheffersomyces stipitis CBS 6054]
MDDVVKSLLRFVTRGFYSVPYVLIMDAVIKHSVLSEDDLIHLLSIKRKELRSLCNKLVDDRLLVNHIQKEESGQPNGQPNGQPKFVTRTYFFIHVTEAIDSIKWKVHYIVNQLKQEMSHFGNPQGYACPRCGKKVSQLDAISLLSEDKTEFLCDVCGGTLVEDDSSQQATLRQEKLEKLMFQVDPIINYLKKIDESNIQDNDFETALIQAIPAQSTSTASYTISNRISSRSRSNMSSSLQNAASKSQATLHVSITANDENYEREQMEKERRRQKLEQNALPSWHSNSTVGKSSLGRLVDEDDYSREGTPSGIKQENEDNMDIDTTNNSIEPSTGQSSVAPTPEPKAALSEIKDKEQQDALAAYYSQLAEREAEEDEDDDDDDDEDDFDDLI